MFLRLRHAILISLVFSRCFGVICEQEGVVLDCLDLQTALERAYAFSPEISMAILDVDIKHAEEWQSSLLPNPVATVEIDGPDTIVANRRGSNGQEVFCGLSQLIELGGKREYRRQEAAFQSSLAYVEWDRIRLNIRREVTLAMVELAAAQEHVKAADQQYQLTHQVFIALAHQAETGKIPPLQRDKAAMKESVAALAVRRAESLQVALRKKLASFWGCSSADFKEVCYPLFELQPIPPLSLLLNRQHNGPDVLKWASLISAAHEELALERARRIPDITVTAGYVGGGGDGNSWTLGVSMPLPVFDRNQGNIQKTDLHLRKLERERDKDALQLQIDLTLAYEELCLAYRESIAFRENIAVSARVAFDAVKEGYAQGKSGYLELLDAQRTLFEVQDQYVHALEEYHRKKTDVERLSAYNFVGD